MFELIWAYLGLFKLIWANLGLLGPFRTIAGLFRLIWFDFGTLFELICLISGAYLGLFVYFGSLFGLSQSPKND